MAGILQAGLPASLRHNIASLWLKSLLFCPRSTTILGEQDLVQALLEEKAPYTLGVATPGAEVLKHSFVATEDGVQWFDFWIRERRLWWKRHGYDRSRYDDARIDADKCQVVYKKDYVIETLTKENRGSAVVIRSEIDLKAAVRWVQEDAFCVSSEARCYRLHYKLAPYQVSVAITSVNLHSRATELLTELKNAYVRCLPTVRLLPTETRSATMFAMEDLLGVCFNVYLEENMKEDDIVKIRNRDTATSENLYSFQVAKTLARYLKTEAPFLVEKPAAKGAPSPVEKSAANTEPSLVEKSAGKKKSPQVRKVPEEKTASSSTNLNELKTPKSSRSRTQRIKLVPCKQA